MGIGFWFGLGGFRLNWTSLGLATLLAIPVTPTTLLFCFFCHYPFQQSPGTPSFLRCLRDLSAKDGLFWRGETKWGFYPQG